MTQDIHVLPEITIIEEKSYDSVTRHKLKSVTIKAATINEAYDMYKKLTK